MPNQPAEQFVANGQERLWATDEYLRRQHAIRIHIRASYREQFAHTSFWRRLRLRWQMQREIEQACAELASEEALYLHRKA